MEIKVNGRVCHSVDEVRQCASSEFADFVAQYFDERDYVVAHTSGSTGEPKEIHLAKADMRASARLTNQFFGIGSGSLLYLPLSPRYIAGKMMIVRAIEAGAAIGEERPSNQPLASYSGAPIDLLAVVPSQVGFLINSPWVQDTVRAMIIGGGRLPERIERWLAERGANAYKTYGMTETCSHVALSRVGEETYEALGDVTFELDSRGCLVINTPQFICHRFVTNDMAELVDERHFCWLGRIDNVINTGGLKVFPEEVEARLARFITHARFFVTPRPSEKWGEELVLAIEYPSLPAGTVKEGEIKPAFIEQLKTALPSHAIPRHYIAVHHFQETPTGKVIRKI